MFPWVLKLQVSTISPEKEDSTRDSKWIKEWRNVPDWITKPFQNQVLSYNPKVSSFTAFGPCVETEMRERRSKAKGLLCRPSSPQIYQSPHPTPPPAPRTSHHFCNGYRPQAVRLQPLRTCQLSGSPQTRTCGDLLPETSPLSAAVWPFSEVRFVPRRELPRHVSGSRSQVRRGRLITRAPPPRTHPVPEPPASPWQPSPSPLDASTRGAPRVRATSPPARPAACSSSPASPPLRPARPGSARPHSLDPGAHGPGASSWTRGPRSALRCPPARGRPASLRRSPRPFLLSLRLGPARSRTAPSPPPPEVKVVAPAGRTPWSRTGRAPPPPSLTPPPPPARAAGRGACWEV